MKGPSFSLNFLPITYLCQIQLTVTLFHLFYAIHLSNPTPKSQIRWSASIMVHIARFSRFHRRRNCRHPGTSRSRPSLASQHELPIQRTSRQPGRPSVFTQFPPRPISPSGPSVDIAAVANRLDTAAYTTSTPDDFPAPTCCS